MTRCTMSFLALLLLVGLVGMAGCGDRDTPDSGGQHTQQADGSKRPKLYLAFGGGPTGGTFNFFASKISAMVTYGYDHLDIAPKGSAGSVENLRSLEMGSVDMAIVYAGDAYLGREGKLEGDAGSYEKARAMAYLYGAPAQLVVRDDSDITFPWQLDSKSVAVGSPGSGAALSAQRFFKHLGIWKRMNVQDRGYSQAAADFADGKIDAFWVLAGYPNSAILEAAGSTGIRLVSVDRGAKASGLYESLPFYSPTVIPAGTYAGQANEVGTFQDTALLCAADTMDDQAVYDILETIFSEKGLEALAGTHRAASDMAAENGIKGVSIPLHPGAVRFWEERGLTIPAHLK